MNNICLIVFLIVLNAPLVVNGFGGCVNACVFQSGEKNKEHGSQWASAYIKENVLDDARKVNIPMTKIGPGAMTVISPTTRCA